MLDQPVEPVGDAVAAMVGHPGRHADRLRLEAGRRVDAVPNLPLRRHVEAHPVEAVLLVSHPLLANANRSIGGPAKAMTRRASSSADAVASRRSWLSARFEKFTDHALISSATASRPVSIRPSWVSSGTSSRCAYCPVLVARTLPWA
jgi:hypothetical protein